MKNLLLALVVLLNGCAYYVVDPGNRGVKVTLGSTSEQLLGEGFGLKLPFITSVYEVSVKQNTYELVTDCFSSNKQQLIVTFNTMVRIPERSVITMFKDYNGGFFETLVAPRVEYHAKQLTALKTVDEIMANREELKIKLTELVRKDLGDLIVLSDLTIKNIGLSKQLMHAIEEKMVQEQSAEKAKFVKIQAQTDAETAIIRAEGQAKALRIQGDAIRANPETLKMELIKKWDGVSPKVVSGSGGTSVILPMTEK